MSSSDLSTLSRTLRIPSQFGRSSNLEDPSTLSDLEKWKNNAASVLKDLLTLLKTSDADAEALSLNTRGDLLFATIPLSSQRVSSDNEDLNVLLENERWLCHESQSVADDILSLPPFRPSVELATHVLMSILKPIFRSSPHPHIHGDTGRRIANPAGDSMAMQDYYEEQKWKDFPGIYKVTLWCIDAIKQDEYERLWHLLIPPIMTLLDDYEARYKLQGVLTVQMLLQHVPVDILKRTGVDGLLKQSLRSCLSHLQSPETPQLLKRAIKTSVALTILTTSISPGIQPSPARFNELTSLLGEGIISGIWIYAEDKPAAVNATFEALPELLKALGIGSVRFLKALIPQLAHTLIPQPLVDPDRELQNSAIAVFLILFDVGAPRINPWKETILDAIGRCWVGLIDEDKNPLLSKTSSYSLANSRANVKLGLQKMCVKLMEICPSVAQVEFPRFLEEDRVLFEGLLPENTVVSP